MHEPVPDIETEIHDQEEFDSSVNRTLPRVIEVVAGVAVFAALVMSAVALSQSSEHNTVTITSGLATPTSSASEVSAGSKAAPEAVSLKVIPEGRVGPDGKKHDYYTKTEFNVKVGQKLLLKIDNTDEGEHSITSPEIGVDIIVKPGIHTYQIVVKEKGRFSWFCVIPCDSNANGWSMQHVGYMRGYITAS